MYTQKERKIIFIKVNSREKENVDHQRHTEKKVQINFSPVLQNTISRTAGSFSSLLPVPPIDPPFVFVFCAAKTKQGEGALAHDNSKSLSDKDKGGEGGHYTC
jgi:hypothetical protein